MGPTTDTTSGLTLSSIDKSLSRNRQKVWGPISWREIKEENKVANPDWVDHQACSLNHSASQRVNWTTVRKQTSCMLLVLYSPTNVYLSSIYCLIWANTQPYTQFYWGANFVVTVKLNTYENNCSVLMFHIFLDCLAHISASCHQVSNIRTLISDVTYITCNQLARRTSDVIADLKEPIHFTCVLINLWSLVSNHKKLYSFWLASPLYQVKNLNVC